MIKHSIIAGLLLPGALFARSASLAETPDSGVSLAQGVQADQAPAKATPSEPLRYYPDRAQRAHVGGNVRLSCLVTAEGKLESCKVLSENPMGYGFGDTALKLALLFKMKPMTLNGKPVAGAPVTIPLKFVPPSDTPPAR